MRLRTILLLLVLITFFSISISGYFYFSYLQTSFFAQIEKEAAIRSTAISDRLSSFLTEQLKPVRTLAGLPTIRQAVITGDQLSLQIANSTLDHFMVSMGADVCYIMDREGSTIASSNRHDVDSFVGQNFSFRPYFQEAIKGIPSTYMALGTTSGKRGAYFSYPIFGNDAHLPAGVCVIKGSVRAIEKELSQMDNEIILLTDPNGIIFISSFSPWLFHSLWELSPERTETISRTLQFGEGPWEWTGMSQIEGNMVVNRSGKEYVLYQQDVENFPGWKIVYMRGAFSSFTDIFRPFLKTTGAFVLPLFVLMVFSVLLLYRKAHLAIKQRQLAESALRESEARYRTLYHNTPALLHSIDPQSRLISISDYWTEVLGYTRQEAIGHKVTEFMTPASQELAVNNIIPQFLQTGFCKDVPYQFIKKNGEVIDVLLSAIAERNAHGNIRRSLAILLDITELKRVEEKLREEEHRRYLSASILNSQERERAAISRELHDELGQLLTALRLDAVWLYDKLRASEKDLADRSHDMCLLIDNTIDEVRKMAIRLRPGVLDDLGLIPALEWLVDDFEQRSGISCTFRPHAIPEVDDPVATAIYRITQEALTNVARHAQASHAEVSLSADKTLLTLTITDDGKGFVNTPTDEANGLGLAGIRERATLIGAEMAISTEEGKGTVVTVKMGLHPEGDKVSISV
jgi:PAS domain S-box-containing protein